MKRPHRSADKCCWNTVSVTEVLFLFYLSGAVHVNLGPHQHSITKLDFQHSETEHFINKVSFLLLGRLRSPRKTGTDSIFVKGDIFMDGPTEVS